MRERPTHIPLPMDQLLAAAVKTEPEPDQTPEIPDVITAKSWSISVDRIFEQEGLRFDATHYDPAIAAHVGSISGDTVPLRDLANLYLPGRFARVWAVDEMQGSPYLNATDLISLFAFGVPSQRRFLSWESNTDVGALVIHEGWLLMTCSGTIGRVHHVPSRLDGWVATHDLIRIVPHSQDITGYLFAWCHTMSAQTQILSHTHGGQIDHVTAEQVGEILIPKFARGKIAKINKSVIDALNAREDALEVLANSWPRSK